MSTMNFSPFWFTGFVCYRWTRWLALGSEPTWTAGGRQNGAFVGSPKWAP